jgi:hypothetical protein
MSDIKSVEEQVALQKERAKEFSELLSTLTTVETKKKMLWAQIYEHAIDDRTNAYILFTDLFISAKGSPSDHQLNGPVLAKYIERMSRANDQILKLAELIQRAQDQEAGISEDEIYNKIQEK